MSAHLGPALFEAADLHQHTHTSLAARGRLRFGLLAAGALVTSALGVAAPAGASVDHTDGPDDVTVLEIVTDHPGRRPFAELVARVQGADVRGRAPGVVLVDVPTGAAARFTDVLTSRGITVRRPVAVDARPEHAHLRTSAPELFGPTSGGADVHTNAVSWHAAGFTGAGVKVGVIDYFDVPLYWNAAEHGPSPVAGVNAMCLDLGDDCTGDFFDGVDRGGEYHGIAVIEALRDMAPDVQVFIGQANSLSDYQALVDWFDAKGVSVITRSLGTRYDGPGDGRGPMNDIAADATSRGMVWINSGGNNALGRYYREPARLSGSRVAFGPSGADTFLDFAGCVRLAGVRWATDWDLPPGDRTDYDIFLWESPVGAPTSGTIIDRGELRQRLGASPLEHLGADHCPASGNRLYLEIRLVAGSAAGDVIEITNYGGDIAEYTRSDHSAAVPIVDSADAGVLAVAAVAAAPGGTIASYSSRGPTNDGRVAPDIAAIGEYPSSVPGTGGFFAGTSAAAPIVAAGAALLIEAELALPGDYVGDLLRHLTIDRGDAGPDATFGHGEFELPDPPDPAFLVPSTYVALDVPDRVLDTRSNKAIGPPALIGTMSAREIIDFPVVAEAGLPAGDVTAVAVNVVSVLPTAASHIQLMPTLQSTVGEFSNLNLDRDGQVRANFAIVPVGQDGSISIMSIAGGDVIVDLLGWFRATPGAADAGRFVALPDAQRVVDSRRIAPVVPIASGEIRPVPMPTGVDLDEVDALVVTVTATLSTDPGWIQIIPAGRPAAIAATSTLNLVPNETVANAAIVPIGPDGVALTSFFANGGSATVIVDVTGYITSTAADASTEGRFVPIRPARAYDSRDAAGPLGDDDVVVVDARPTGVPIDAGGVMWNLTAAATTRPGHTSGWATGGTEPSTSVLNWSAPGMTRASSAVIAANGGSSTFSVEDGPVNSPAPLTHFIADVFGYFT